MDINKFKYRHMDTLCTFADLHQLVKTGIEAHAADISQRIIAMSGAIRLYLTAEDKVLHPALEASGNVALVRMGRRYRQQKKGIAGSYLAFTAQWNAPWLLAEEPEMFRAEANRVLKTLYERMKKEDRKFYPAIEATHPVERQPC